MTPTYREWIHDEKNPNLEKAWDAGFLAGRRAAVMEGRGEVADKTDEYHRMVVGWRMREYLANKTGRIDELQNLAAVIRNHATIARTRKLVADRLKELEGK